MTLQLITAPAIEPLSLEEVKLHCKIEDVADDALVRAIIVAVREQAEHKTGRALIDQRWEQVLNWFPTTIELGYPPLVAVESVKYTDSAGATQTISSANYIADDVSSPPKIYLGYGASWPANRDVPNAIRARFIAGHACGVTAVAATDVLTHSGLRTIALNDPIRLSNSGGALPAPLAAGPTYYAVNVSGATFKLSLTPSGAAIDITDAGTGTHYLGTVPKPILSWMLIAAATMYEQRESVVTGTIATKLAFVDRLLDRHTVPRL